MPPINTFVFFDLETTGLPMYGAKITELVLVACSKDHLLSSQKGKVPRVIHKLLIPINPYKTIQPKATEITGLDNWMLEYTKKFDKNTVETINCFFNQLNKPICMVAHNGNYFDYPILKRQMRNLDCGLDADLLCVDSLPLMRKIDQESPTTTKTSSPMEEFLTTNLQAVQRRNEKTPSKRSLFAVVARKPYDKPAAARCLFGAPTIRRSTSAPDLSALNKEPCNVLSVKKTSIPTNQTACDVRPGRVSYKLCDVYQRLHSYMPKDLHNAESDSIHLLLCAIAMKEKFVAFAEDMATNFNDTQFN